MAVATHRERWKRGLQVLCCISLISQPILFAASPAIVRKMGISIPRARQLRYRDEASYWLIPWKQNEDSAFRWAFETLEWASVRNGIILGDSTTKNALLFVQRYWHAGRNATVESRGCGLPNYRTDMAGFRRAAGERPLYVLSDSPEYLGVRFGPLLKLTRVEKNEGDLLYQLRWLAPAAEGSPSAR